MSPSSRSLRIHHVKSRVLFYEKALDGSKAFEIRFNDSDYQVGDILVLEEWDDRCPISEGFYTGRKMERLITYMTEFEQKPGWVVLGLAR